MALPREIGNVSSASVLHILRDARAKPPPSGTPGAADGDGARLLRGTGAAALALSCHDLYVLLIAAVAVERVAELVVSQRNSGLEPRPRRRRVRRAATIRRWSRCTPACWRDVWWRPCDRPFLPALGWPMLVVVLAAQGLRWWCIATLGRQWNTRVVVIPEACAGRPAARTGSSPTRTMSRSSSKGSRCRWCTSAWVTAVVFTVLNAFVLRTRIGVENAALARLR